ncbi:MAG: winged helix-turn-helix domain-containing protein [Pirellulaceae bacterium]
MATATELNPCVAQIGEVAGQIWHTLEDEGPKSVSKLVKSIDAPRDTVMQALGWLAREDKIDIDETNRGRVVSLRM